MTPEFKPFPKISRWANSKIAITEKIDGTNGVISIGKFAGCPEDSAVDPTILCASVHIRRLFVGIRKKRHGKCLRVAQGLVLDVRPRLSLGLAMLPRR